MKPVVLLFGPSGVGKSTIAEQLVTDFNFLHLSLDYWDKKGVDGRWLRDHISNPRLFYSEINQKLNEWYGAVVTFPSTDIPDPNLIKILEELGIKTLILYGPKDSCLNAFLKRGTPPLADPVDHWHKCNDDLYDNYILKPEYNFYLVQVFKGKDRISNESLLELIKERVGF